MRLLIFIVIILSIPTFAQDDRPRRLNEDERKQSIKLGCIRDGNCKRSHGPDMTSEQKRLSREEMDRQIKAWGNKPIRIPLSDQELKEYQERLVALGSTVVGKATGSQPDTAGDLVKIGLVVGAVVVALITVVVRKRRNS